MMMMCTPGSNIKVANWHGIIIRSIGDRFAAGWCLYDLYLQRFHMVCARGRRRGRIGV